MRLEVGSILEGRVTGITAFGAFVALPEGKSGLIHISEVANAYVSDVHAFLSVGQTVKVRVMSISREGKISLSAKRAEEAPGADRPARKAAEAAQRPPVSVRAGQEGYVPTRSGDQVFEDKLKQFMQEADSKISGSRLYDQQKRSRGRRNDIVQNGGAAGRLLRRFCL